MGLYGMRDYAIFTISYEYDQTTYAHDMAGDKVEGSGITDRIHRKVRIVAKNEIMARAWFDEKTKFSYVNGKINLIERDQIDAFLLEFSY